MSDETEMVKEVAITTGKGIDASREFGKFISEFIRGSLKQGMGIFEDRLWYMRWERQMRLMQKAKAFMEEIGMTHPTRELPMKFAIPLFSGASLEGDDYLQDRWASLLVNAANAESGIDQKRAYIDILESIEPLEAKILEKIYSFPFDKIQHAGVFTHALPDKVSLGDEESSEKDIQPGHEVAKALGNLARLGCIRFRTTWGGREVYSWVNPTILGDSFVRACTLRK